MRILFALIYIFLGIWIYFILGGGNLHPYIGIAFGFILMFSSVVVCNEGFLRRLKGQTDEYAQELIDKGKAVLEKYNVFEAITFDDLSTGCLCHLLKVDEDKIVCLYGQYLYEYVDIVDDPELNQSRSFPTCQFSVIRRLKNGDILRLDVGDNVVKEERYENVNIAKIRDLGINLKDGEVFKNIDFKALKRAFA